MPVPYTQISTGGLATDDAALAAWPNGVYADIASIIPEINDLRAQATATNTYTAGKLTQIDCGSYRWVINYTGRKVSTIELRTSGGTLIYTYTPTYSGRQITALTRT